MQSNEKKSGEATPVRPKRTPLSMTGRNILTVKGQEVGFHYRFVNDVGDRVDMMKDRGYEVVTHEVSVGDRRVANTKQAGSPTVMSVGGGTKAVLMRIPQEWFDEDQAIKEAEVIRSEEAIKGKINPQTGAQAGDYGSVSITK